MIDVARRRARSRRIRHARFRVADAQSFRWRGAPFDAAISRYALMFAEDIDAALARIHAAVRPGGRLAVAVWGRERGNPGFAIRMEAARPFRREGESEQSLPKRGLSPLRFADPARLLRAIRRAGFRAARAERVYVESVHQSPETFARFTVASSMSDLYDELKPADRRRLLERLARGVAPYRAGSVIRIPGEAWVLAARRGRGR
jgi:SAM-dependent methyltransferase